MTDTVKPMRALIAGGSTDIGAAVARRLVAGGKTVVVLDIQPPEIEQVQFVSCDLSREESINRAVGQLTGSWNCLLNIAGIPGPKPALPVVAVNFLGLRHLTVQMLPKIAEGGTIVNVSSTAGRNWQRRAEVVRELIQTQSFAEGLEWCAANASLWDRDPYTFSKQCVTAWTFHAAGLGRRHQVRVNCVSPGGTNTRLTENFTAQIGTEQVEWMNAQVGRSAEPDDIAAVVEFLGVGDCGWLNGADIVVDGGLDAGLIDGWADLSQSPAMRQRQRAQ